MNEFQSICDELDIDTTDMMDKPHQFIERIMTVAKRLGDDLERKTNLTDLEHDFKVKARGNPDAKARAEEIYSNLLDTLLEESPEVLANFINLIPDLTQFVVSNVRTHAIRDTDGVFLNKKQLHMQYIRLKKCYDAYTPFVKMFNDVKFTPIMPAKSGNYGTPGGVKTYIFTVDGIEVVNPYKVAKKLGLEIKFYMDLIEIIDKNDGVIAGHVVEYTEV